MTMFDLGGETIVEIGGRAVDTQQQPTVPIRHCELSPSAYAEELLYELRVQQAIEVGRFATAEARFRPSANSDN
jgi:hypothetical protein